MVRPNPLLTVHAGSSHLSLNGQWNHFLLFESFNSLWKVDVGLSQKVCIEFQFHYERNFLIKNWIWCAQERTLLYKFWFSFTDYERNGIVWWSKFMIEEIEVDCTKAYAFSCQYRRLYVCFIVMLTNVVLLFLSVNLVGVNI